MKIQWFVSFTFLVGMSVHVCTSQNVAAPYQVATWYGFHDAAISYTFDDNCSNQLAVAVPMFDSYGFRLTLFTVMNWSPNWTGLQLAASEGHEIGNHTVSHPSLGTLTVDEQRAEITTASSLINSHITGQQCLTLAYPNCSEGSDTLCEKYFVAARGCQNFTEGSTPGNFMYVSSVICGALGIVKTSQDFKTRADGAAASHGWLVYLIHGIDGDGGYSALPSDTLRASLEYLNAHREKFWVAPFGDVARYIRERNCLTVRESSNQDSSIMVQVTDTLDNNVYDVPVTIRRPLPPTWSSVTASQNGKPIPASVIQIDSTRLIDFETVPDGGDVELKQSATTGMRWPQRSSPTFFTLRQNYPNPFNPTTVIAFQIAEQSYVSLRVFDILGREVAVLINEEKRAGSYAIDFHPDNLSSGTYFYTLISGHTRQTKSMNFVK